MPDIEKKVVPFCRDDLLASKEKDQLAEWRASFRENGNCAKALDKAMSDNFADNRMDTKKVLDTVVAEFGFERTAHVLTAQVFNHNWDGRYHSDVKDWAKEQMKDFSADFIEESRDYYLNSHPILIDGVAKTAMTEQVKEISQDKSDHDVKPPEPEKEPEKANEPENPKFKSAKEKVAEITDKLESGIKELFSSEKFKSYLNTMSKFHNYSFNNTLLIAMQKPDATLVAGFNAWKNNFGRNVNKGEKGIQIFAPAPYKIKKEEIKRDPDTDLPILDKDGKPIVEEVERVIPNFKVVSVFDVSQTNGKELPTLGVDELSGNVTDYEKFFEALKEVSPVPIKLAEIDGSAKGFFNQEDKTITIKEGMSEAQTVKTAIHEIAHAMLHDKDLKKADLEKPKDRATEEVEAESIAYTVCQHFGVDTSDYSFSYVASWGSGKDLPELKSSLETIRSTASELITQISDKYLGLDKDKSQEKTAEAPEQPKKSNIIGNVEYSTIEDKQYFRLNSDTAQKVAEKLTEQNVPFSGRINGDKTILTIGKADVESYKAFMAEIKGQAKDASEQEKAAEAPEKPKKSNIIGNVQYKSIENKQYFKLDTDTAQNVAEKLTEQNIPFSGRITGENTTLTIGKANVENYKAVIAEVTGNVKETPTVEQPKAEPALKKDKGTIIGNTEYKDIPNKSYAKLSTEKALAVAEILDSQGVKFSGRTVGDKTTLTISKEDLGEYKKALATVNKAMQMEEKQKKAPEMQEYTGKMPDEKITIAERNAYGYDSNELLPLTAEKALEFFDNDTVAVYLLYPDGTEGQANERSDIENHNGIFGVETVEWERYQAFEKRMDDLAAQEPSREALLLNSKECAAGIYQLKSNPENRDIRFMDSSYLEMKGIEPCRDNYTLVYSFPVLPEELQNKSAFLEQVFEKFNTDHPKDFAGHSLSVSDVVVIQQNGELSAHYVDRAGFTELANFGAVRENPLKAVEDTIEQNDNKLDGIINNTPTMDELEERANRGEQVSISEMFDAAKAEHAAKKQPEVKKPVKKAEEKRSIRQYLKQSQDKKPEQPKEKAQEKSKGVEL